MMHSRFVRALPLLTMLLGCNPGPAPLVPNVKAHPEDVVLKQVGYALYEYNRINGEFPCRVSTHEGKLQSWRHELLPFLLGHRLGDSVQQAASDVANCGASVSQREVEDGLFVAEEAGRDKSVLCQVFLVAGSRKIWSEENGSERLRDLRRCDNDAVLAVYCEEIAAKWWSTTDVTWDMSQQRLIVVGDNALVLSKSPRSILMADGSVRHVVYDELRVLLNAN